MSEPTDFFYHATEAAAARDAQTGMLAVRFSTSHDKGPVVTMDAFTATLLLGMLTEVLKPHAPEATEDTSR